MSKLQWWGYRHITGTISLKRYWDKRDIQDALESDFVVNVYGPFEADTRDEASDILQQNLNQ